MSSSPRVDFSPLGTFPMALKEGVQKNLPDSSEKVCFLLESSALTQICHATLRNIPALLFSSESSLTNFGNLVSKKITFLEYMRVSLRDFGVNDFFNLLSTRVTYLEATVLSLASMIHNFVMALLYTGLVAITFGLSENLNYNCRKHWSHVSYAYITSWIGVLGILVPSLGALFNYKFVYSTYVSVKNAYRNDLNIFENQLVSFIKRIFKKHARDINKFFENYVKDSYQFKEEHKPSLEHIQSRIKRAEKVEDLTQLIVDIYEKFPKMVEKKGEALRRPVESPAAQSHYQDFDTP